LWTWPSASLVERMMHTLISRGGALGPCSDPRPEFRSPRVADPSTPPEQTPLILRVPSHFETGKLGHLPRTIPTSTGSVLLRHIAILRRVLARTQRIRFVSCRARHISRSHPVPPTKTPSPHTCKECRDRRTV